MQLGVNSWWECYWACWHRHHFYDQRFLPYLFLIERGLTGGGSRALVAFFRSDPIIFNDLIYLDDTVDPIRKYDSFADPPPTGTTFPTVIENTLFSAKRP